MIDGTAGVRGFRHVDEGLLDDPDAIAANDPGGMLRATAAAGAQVRESAALAAEANLAVLGEEGRPRAVVVAGQQERAGAGHDGQGHPPGAESAPRCSVQ